MGTLIKTATFVVKKLFEEMYAGLCCIALTFYHSHLFFIFGRNLASIRFNLPEQRPRD